MSLAQALVELRDTMAKSGKPTRRDYRDAETYNADLALWERAKTVLAWYEREAGGQ